MMIKVQMAIMSHLSDCQEMLTLSANNEYVTNKLNFVKKLVMSYPDTAVEVEESALNELWNETMNKE